MPSLSLVLLRCVACAPSAHFVSLSRQCVTLVCAPVDGGAVCGCIDVGWREGGTEHLCICVCEDRWMDKQVPVDVAMIE